MKRGAGVAVAILALAFAACGAVDLVVLDPVLLPEQTETLVNPEQVRFTLGNYGPDASGYVDVEYMLSRNQVAGDADDRVLAAPPAYYVPLDAGTGGYVELPASYRAALTIPPDASGDYFVFIRVSPSGETDLDPNDNIAWATNRLSVGRLGANTYAVFANSQIVASNMSVTPGLAFEYNAHYGNNWRMLNKGGGLTATFTVPAGGEYALRVRHLTSWATNCPGNGYSPVTILVNGACVVTNFDVALAHEGTHWYATDVWPITAQEGDNTLEWVAGDLCTHYWLQRLEITRALKFTAVTRQQGGAIQLMLTGEPGRTNAIEVSTNLVDWTWQTNLFNATGIVQWNDAPPPGSNRRFYRALAL